MAVVRVAARNLTGADGTTFILREGEQVYYAEENAVAPLWKGKRFPAKACVSGWSMIHRQAAIIEDVYADPRVPTDAYTPTFVKSMAMIPVRVEDPIAAIGAYWATRHRATEAEVETLQSIANATALALQNAQLYSELEAALKQEHSARIQAEDATRVRDEWLSIISHELRTPLTPIYGWLQLLKSGKVPPEKMSDALHIIERNLNGHIRIVEDLLDASKMLTGRFEMKRVAVDVSDCLTASLEAEGPVAQKKSITLKVVSARRPLFINGDGDRLCQIIHNLLDNAIKFTPSGGVIEVGLWDQDGFAELTVRDNGVGIAPESLPYIFERFHQVDSSHTRSAGGLGLGLSIVQQIVQLHGGSITISSKGVGKGALVAVRLPLMAN